MPVSKTPMISISAAAGLIEAIKAAGANPDDVLGTIAVDSAIFANPDGFIRVSTFARILEEAARVSSDACFGLHFGERYNPKNIGSLVYVVLNSPTIAAGIENTARFIKIHNEAARASLLVEKDRAYLRFLPNELLIHTSRQHSEYAMAVALNTLRLMVGSEWAPQEVHFTHQLEVATPEHFRVFCAPIMFGCPANAFVVESDFLKREVPAADPRLYRILKRYLGRVLHEMPREDDLLAAVRRMIGEAIRDAEPKLSLAAKKLGMSPRRLQRRLQEYGLDFKRLVDDTRQRLALQYIKEEKDTLTQIAFMLGYSDVSAFNRAFKRWTGTAPLEYRRTVAKQARTYV
ncbi:MAG TPA: AraC family transcriptional regulator ligand-binding domain-containing protein [Candidatus Binatia bacterium]|nr:AraC family transcriptional regulator ligand-binding domain-containing protein [Candidatus Binatia bacterium]